MKKQFFIFTTGFVAGCAIASGVFFIFKSDSAAIEKRVCTKQNSGDCGNTNALAVEFFPPAFTKESCRHWSNYADYLMHGGYNHTNWDMAMASGLGSFLTEVELYIFTNEKARMLKGKDRQEFVAQHRKWLKWWNEESKKTVRDPDGNIIEGTMAIPIQAAHPGSLIEEYLKKFPDRAKLKYDYVAEYEKKRKKK